MRLKEIVLGHIREMAELIVLDEDRMLRSLQDRLIGERKAGKADAAKDRRELEQQLYTLETRLY
jgi:cytoskeletal protein RodZ